MCAFLIVCDKLVFVDSHQHGRLMRLGVIEYDRVAYAKAIADARIASERGMSANVLSDFESGSPVASFGTTWGPTADSRQKPDLVAPGDRVITAQHHTTGSATWTGTSFAAPNVAGM